MSRLNIHIKFAHFLINLPCFATNQVQRILNLRALQRSGAQSYSAHQVASDKPSENGPTVSIHVMGFVLKQTMSVRRKLQFSEMGCNVLQRVRRLTERLQG